MPTATRGHQRRYSRAAAHRGQGLRRRRPPEPTGFRKVLRAVIPGAAVKKAAPSSKKSRAGGLALAAAAAGMAFKNRDKVSRLRHRNGDGAAATTTPGVDEAGPTPPATPAV